MVAGLNSISGQPPMSGPARGVGGSVGPVGVKPYSSGPAAPATPAASPGFGQINDPGAYGTPGAAASSPLGMWQSWLDSMGPYLAQMPNSMPNVESGGLSSLAPSQVTPGTMKGYWGGDAGWEGKRGFTALRM